MGSRRVRGGLVLAVVAMVGACWQVSAQSRRRPAPSTGEAERRSSLRVDTNLVLVPVSVCDSTNRPITGLEREHFKLFDDRVEQTVTHFAMDDEPVAVGIVLDISGSMGGKLRLAREAAAQFFKSANADDEFFLVEFNDTPRLVTSLTPDYEGIQNQLTFAQSKGRTALLDAVILAMHEIRKSQKKRRALLILSDGGDNASRYSEGEVRSLIRESDVLIYAVGLFEPSGRARTSEEASGPGLLSDVAEQTGGRHFPAETHELPDIAAKIGVELRNRYVLGYSPTDYQRDGRYHKVEVKLAPPRGLPKMQAHWRTGYYAPAE
jgi:VWFA-related protein